MRASFSSKKEFSSEREREREKKIYLFYSRSLRPLGTNLISSCAQTGSSRTLRPDRHEWQQRCSARPPHPCRPGGSELPAAPARGRRTCPAQTAGAPPPTARRRAARRSE